MGFREIQGILFLTQAFRLSRTKVTTHYLFFLGLYRALYLVNWIWRFYFEGFFDLIAVVAGVVQTILYCDFFYLYITKGASGCVRPASLFQGSLGRRASDLTLTQKANWLQSTF